MSIWNYRVGRKIFLRISQSAKFIIKHVRLGKVKQGFNNAEDDNRENAYLTFVISHFQFSVRNSYYLSLLVTNLFGIKYNLSCNYEKGKRKKQKTQRQNKRHKEGKCMGTGHHQWLSNEAVVAMETRLYETLPKKRPCPVPRSVCVSVCVSLVQTHRACLPASADRLGFYEFCPLWGLETGLRHSPSLSLHTAPRWRSTGVYVFNYSPSPDPGFLTSLNWPTKWTTSRSLWLCVLSLMPQYWVENQAGDLSA